MSFNNEFTEESLIIDLDNVLNKLGKILSLSSDDEVIDLTVSCMETLESIQNDLINEVH